METKSNPTSYRLTPAAKELIAEMAEAGGVSRVAIIETAVRNLYWLQKAQGIVKSRR